MRKQSQLKRIMNQTQTSKFFPYTESISIQANYPYKQISQIHYWNLGQIIKLAFEKLTNTVVFFTKEFLERDLTKPLQVKLATQAQAHASAQARKHKHKHKHWCKHANISTNIGASTQTQVQA